MKRTCIILEFGLGGHSEEYAPTKTGGATCTGRLSGYDRPHNWEPNANTDYPDGTPVLDKREALEENTGLVFRSPIVSHRDEPFTLPNDVPLPGENDEPGPLDYVRVPRFVAWWAKHGAKVGRIENRKIVWE